MNKQVELLINDYPIRIDLAQGRSRPKVACLGPAGTNGEEARHQLLKESLEGMDADFLDLNTTVVQRVKKGDYDLGVVPVENAIEGDVAEVLRELNHARHLNILGETIIGIHHMLIGWPEEKIEEIRSHSQALGQCRKYLLTCYPQTRIEPYSSTAAAVELTQTSKSVAAIASERAAKIHNVPILARDIGDIKGNSTRFILLGRGSTEPTGQDSTAFVFVPTGDRPGILARCLTALASYGINLTKLDSRPTGKLREYAFWVTIDGHVKDENLRRGLDDLRKTYCSSLWIMGSYRKALIPKGVREPGSLNGHERS